MTWLKYTRGQIKPFIIDPNIWGVYEFASLKKESLITKCIYSNFGPKLWFCWEKEETERCGKKMVNFLRDGKSLKCHFDYFKKIAERAVGATEEIRAMDLKNLSDSDLVSLFDFLSEAAKEGLGMLAIDIDAMDYFFEDFLKKEIKKELGKIIKEKDFLEIYKQLTKTTYLSFVSQQEKEIIKIAISKRKKEEVVKEDIDRLQKKFWWTKIGWEDATPHKRSFFEKEIEKYSKYELRELGKKLLNMENYSKENKKEREKTLKEYGLSSQIRHWLFVLDEYTKFHDIRKESQMRVLYSSELLLAEVAKRKRVKQEDLEWLFYDEVKEFINGNVLNKEEIAKRKKAIFLLLEKNKYKLMSGKKAQDFFDKNLKEDIIKIREIKGLGVSSGKVRGKVKVCSGGKEAQEKVEKGDILVTGMTLPDYVPAMKKSAAIITDEGGLTCHAAIISRELGIPCIVGTKIATEVLKDGDLVEVDADEGLIKIIK